MKKFTLIFLAILVSVIVARAQFTFTTNNNAITITWYSGPGGVVVVPDSTNGYPVTSIAGFVFEGGGPTSVIIPDSVTSIASYVFYSCPNLTNVTFGAGINSIPDGAFINCGNLLSINVNITNASYSSLAGALYDKNLTDLIQYPTGQAGGYTVPSGVTKIGGFAFNGSSALTSLSLPASVTNINTSGFSPCYSLTNISVDPANPVYSSTNGIVFNKVQNALLVYPDGITGACTIPTNITTIGSYAFIDNTNLTQLIVPTNVTSIGSYGFYGCKGLTNATLSYGLTNLGAYAFSYCASLANIGIPGSVTAIGNNAFAGCSGASTLIISNGVTSTGTNTFMNCIGLTNVVLPGSITNLSDGAFYGCSQLAVLNIPASVIAIGANTFQNCSSLWNVTLPAGLGFIGNYAFERCLSLAQMAIPNQVKNIGTGAFEFCPSLTAVTIGTGVTNIASYAFDHCTNLTSLTIASSVTNLVIGYAALGFCTSLTNVVLPAGVKSIGSWAFQNDGHLAAVYFKGRMPVADSTIFGSDTLTVYYLSGTPGWGSTFENRPTAIWKPALVPGMQTNGFGLNITWTSGQTIIVESCTNLLNPVWQPLLTNSLTTDSTNFSDTQWTNYLGCFYRVHSP